MLRRYVRTVACLSLGAVAISGVAMAGPDPDRKPDPSRRSAMMIDELKDELKNEERAIEARMKLIADELKTLDRGALKDTDWAKEWAGDYSTGDGLGENASVSLSPTRGIAFLNYGCLGLYGGDHGEIVEANLDGVKLKLKFGSAKNSFLSERMYFVPWGEERYLVPDWQMKQFANNYNQGGYARESMFGILRRVKPGESGWAHVRGDGAARAGRPKLPAEFAALLRDRPVTLKVTNAVVLPVRNVTGNVDAAISTLEFEGGMEQGAFVGMEIRYPAGEPTLASGTIQIMKVEAKTCSGEFVAFVSHGTVVKFPAVGEVVKSGEEKK